MLIGFDANFFTLFINALIAGNPLAPIEAETKAEGLAKIIADEQGLVLQEWRDSSGSHAREFVEEWISEALADDRIVLKNTTGCNTCRSDVRQKGMPSKDAKRLSIYKDAGADVVISEDIDFFEPAEGNCSQERRRKLCYGRSGSLCRHIEKRYGIAIHTHDSFLESF